MQAKTDASNSNSNSNSANRPAASASGGSDAKDVKPDVEGGEDEQDGAENDNGNEGEGRRTRKRRLGVDPSLIISDGRSKRRRTPSPEPVKKEEGADPKDPERAAMLGRELYTKIMDSKDNEGESMAEPFIKLPPKRQFPDYYEIIKHPMSLDTVDAKLKNKEYQTLKEVVTDIGQIFNNAKRYNMKESLLFIYAKKLHKMTRTFYIKITNPNEEQHDSEDDAPPPGSTVARQSSAARRESTNRRERGSSALGPNAGSHGAQGQPVEPDDEDDEDDGMDGSGGGPRHGPGVKRGTYMKNGPTVYKLVKPVLKIIKETKARDGTGRDIAGIFEYLPDRRELPDYYVAIKNPISLAEIEDRMVSRKYESWEEFFDDVDLMCSNAMEYNEDGSEVYQDAQHIKEILDYNRAEIKTRLTLPIAQQRQRLKPVNTPSRQSAQLGTPGSAGSHSLPLPGDGRRTSGSPMPGPSGYYGSPLAGSSTNLHPHVPVNPHAAGAGYGGAPASSGPGTYPNAGTASSQPALGSGSNYANLPTQGAPATPQFRAPLPSGQVTEAIVASLPQYTEAEKRAWYASLTQGQLTMYRSFSATIEARRRAAQGLPPMPLADMPGAVRPGGAGAGAGAVSGAGGANASTGHSVQAQQVFKRAKPALPGVKVFEFGFETEGSEWEVEDESGEAGEGVTGSNGDTEAVNGAEKDGGDEDISMDGAQAIPSTPAARPSTGTHKRQKQQRSIRLHNLRGVGTHALLVGPATTRVSLSAYYSDFVISAMPSASSSASGEGEAGASRTAQQMPQVALRINGAPLPLSAQTTIYEPLKRLGADDDLLSRLPTAEPSANGTDAASASEAASTINAQKARGVRWTVDIPAGQPESTLQITLVRPAVGQPGAGSITEISTIYVARQF